MGTTDKYCLRWNDYRSNISLAFQDLRSSADFFDVTLATEDSEIRAHRVILSACSPHLRDLLKRHSASNQQNLLIYLRGVRQSDLEAILEFMYNGEVNVAQEDLNSFLAVAEDLKVKGLTQNANSADSGGGGGNSNHVNPALTTPTPPSARPKSSASSSPAVATLKNGSPAIAAAATAQPPTKRFKRESSGAVKVKEESGTNQQLVVTPEISYEQPADDVADVDDEERIDEAGYDADDTEAYPPYGNYEGEGVDPSTLAVAGTSGVDGSKELLDFSSAVEQEVCRLIYSSTTPLGDGSVLCTLCGTSIKQRCNLKRHMRDKHVDEGVDYVCPACRTTYRSRNSFQAHVSMRHKTWKKLDVTRCAVLRDHQII